MSSARGLAKDSFWSYVRVLVLGIVLFSIAMAGGFATPTQAQSDERCFAETGYCISGAIRAYWETHGGVAVFGYPITPRRYEFVEENALPVQWFERDRLEDHGERGIMPGRLGVRLLEERNQPWQLAPRVGGVPEGCVFFAETGHSLCDPFLGYWLNNGALERLGYPITEPRTEQVGDWEGTVQYFERRRLEYHPERPQQPILAGLLGNEIMPFIGTTPDYACRQEVVSGLQELLRPGTYVRNNLGCPHDSLAVTSAAEQYFERGVMLYLEEHPQTFEPTIFVITTEPLPVRYQMYEDTWEAWQPVSGYQTPPAGMREPEYGFGKVWRERPGVFEALGWATQRERQDHAVYQHFDHGYVIWLNDADFVYVFFPDGAMTAMPRVWPQGGGP